MTFTDGSLVWVADVCCAVQPPLGFTPPELVGGCSPGSEVVLSGAVDCFSLAALTYLLAAGQPGEGLWFGVDAAVRVN